MVEAGLVVARPTASAKSRNMRHLAYKAVILDMDGVITRTTQLHNKACKQLFDEFLANKESNNAEPFSDQDYQRYLNGTPRYKGVRCFLESRNISIPKGTPSDGPGQETIYGLGARKNEYFLKLLEEEGLQVFEDARQMIEQWQQQKMPMAVVSSSRNAEKILTEAGLIDSFSVRIDGETAAAIGMVGKPDPDAFLKASQQLGIAPQDTLVLEDAIAGVQAGRRGGFGWVVGVARNGEDKDLEQAGAHFTIHTLTELNNYMQNQATAREANELPHALESKQEIRQKLKGFTPILFLDYDGTLCPIVKDPDKAIMSDEMKSILSRLANKVTVAVVSGRDRADVQQKVDLEQVVFAGSHGFDIEGPNGLAMQYEGGQKAQPALDEATQNLNSKIGNITGIHIERKKYAIAVHYRNVADEQVDKVRVAVKEELDRQDKLKGGGGKKILELKPNIDWHKGRATEWLLDKLNPEGKKILPIFIGDDLTDEDGLEAVHNRGIGILAGEHGEKTWAHYRVEDVEEVKDFLQELDTILAEDVNK